MTERTLVLVKPDGVERGLVGEVLARAERRGYQLIALRMFTVERELAEQHYHEHAGKPFFNDLVEFVVSGPLVAAVLEGPDVIAGWRSMMGATNPVTATPGTIRGDLATVMRRNIVHGSDSTLSAAREIGLFFPDIDR
jgi:nucleoside-diphosphate kinase